MALEPITRQEKIIAGQDLTPITRMEMFLKNFGGGGGGTSSADVFIIHATTDETLTNAQLDKTAEQISEAYQSGKYCLVCTDGVFMQVISVTLDERGDSVKCCGFSFQSFQGGLYGAEFIKTSDGVTWAVHRKPNVLLYNVGFKGLQITGYGNRLYTLSVDADGNLTATAVT